MRKELDLELTALACVDPRVALVVADLGPFSSFREQHPSKFYNVGVAEANSVGLAAGLASEGRRVFLFGVAGFTIYRAFEQLKFDIGYWKQPVCVIGTGFGWKYFRLGRGHHAPDDFAMMQLIPNFRFFAPATAKSLGMFVRQGYNMPCYIRLGEGLPPVKIPPPAVGLHLRLIALGELQKRCISAVQRVRALGWDVGLTSIEELSPEGVVCLLGKPTQSPPLFVVEDHVRIGGIGDLIRNCGYPVADHLFLPTDVERISNSEEELVTSYGFDSASLEDRMIRILRKTTLANGVPEA